MSALLTEELLTPEELATRWNVSVRTLANNRSLGRGPGFVRLGRSVLYRASEIQAYEDKHYVKPVAA